MIILGIDPGIAIVGYGIIEYKNNKFRVIDYGAITTPSTMNTTKRLERIYKGIDLLIKNYNMKEGEKYMGLNENCNEQAYVLGRLFAILELVQKDANPGINSTIKERYFNSACATPASVFPILIKLKNSHLKKIERSSTGLKIQYEKTITELMGKLNIAETQIGFPRRLSLEEQGKFMLGYYHQIQKRYEKKEDK